MVKTIRLKDYALQEGFEESLTFRPVAKSIYAKALLNLQTIFPGDIVDCDFTGIEMCDVSFADEFIINLQKHLVEIDNTVLRIVHVKEYVQENIEGALMLRNKKDRTKLNLLLFVHDSYSILGDIEKNLLDTFSLFSIFEHISARELAEQFSIEVNSASNRLKKLYDLRLLLRSEVIDSNGRKHIYYLPK